MLTLAALPVRPDSVGRIETGVFDLVNGLPGWLYPVVFVVMQLGAFPAGPAVGAVALAFRRWRLALDAALAGGAAWLVARFVKEAFGRARPADLLDTVVVRGEPAAGLGFVSGHSAVAIALATATSPYLARRWRRVVWALATIVCLSRMYVGAHLPLDVVGGAGVGWALGALIHTALGTPTGRPATAVVARLLASVGHPVGRIEPAAVDATASAAFVAETRTGEPLFVKLVAREPRDRDLVYRWFRLVVPSRHRASQLFRSASLQVAHEAALTLLAQQAGVRVPAVRIARELDDRAGLLVLHRVDGPTLDEVAGAGELSLDLLVAVITEVERLHTGRLVHRDLVRSNVIVDPAGQPWLTDFGNALSGASDEQRAADLGELLVSLAAVAGSEATVRAAIAASGRDRVTRAIAAFGGEKLPAPILRDLGGQPGLAAELASALRAAPDDGAEPERTQDGRGRGAAAGRG